MKRTRTNLARLTAAMLRRRLRDPQTPRRERNLLYAELVSRRNRTKRERAR